MGGKELLYERILFLVDIDPESSECDLLVDSNITRLDLIKQAICNFIVAKHTLSQDHTFAIAILADDIQLLSQFQSSEDLAETLSMLDSSPEPFVIRPPDLSNIQEQLNNASAGLEEADDIAYRIVLIYTRSQFSPG